MKFYAFEVASDTCFVMYVNIDEQTVENHLKDVLGDWGIDDETLLIGTVQADSVDEAHNKIRSGEWEYTQRC